MAEPGPNSGKGAGAGRPFPGLGTSTQAGVRSGRVWIERPGPRWSRTVFSKSTAELELLMAHGRIVVEYPSLPAGVEWLSRWSK